MVQNDPKNYLDWFFKAQEDESNIVSLLKHRDGTPGMVCFISQQMAEKYLKAFLVYAGKPFKKVHDLIELESSIYEKEKSIGSLHDDLKLLNRYYIETRYPGDYPEFLWQEAEEAYEAAKKIKNFVIHRVETETK
ncbi:MAG: HEPN domain-containing protein [Parcubacteria group bacterium]